MADQDGSDASPAESQGSDSQVKSEEGASSRPDSSGSRQATTPIPTPSTTPPASNNAATKPKPLVLMIDERQRLARERRDESQKQTAVRESQWQERDERAKQYYEKHLEERRRKLEDQRFKEDKRRTAVEEKRRQKLDEDKARHEAVMRRTLERSQRAKPKPNRWSWGGAMTSTSPTTPSGFVESAFLYPLDLAGLEHHLQGAFSLYRRYGMSSRYADRRSVSTMNLSKHADPVITKRLSYSSATLLHSPDRALQKRTSSSSLISKSHSKPRLHWAKTAHDKPTGMRRMPLTTWENTMVSRLQQPTHSYLARSRSAMSLSGEAVSCHPMGSMSFKSIQSQPQCRSQERSLPKDGVVRRRTSGTTQQKDRDFARKSWSNLSLPLAPILSLPPAGKRTPSPGNQRCRGTAPSPGRPPQKSIPRPPTPKQLKSPSGEDPGNMRPARATPESPRGSPGPEGEQEVQSPDPHTQPRPQPLGQSKSSTDIPVEGVGSPPAHRPSAGTSDPEEATRILAEKRRQAREQREKEEEERRLQEEAEKRGREEMARRKAEERARREEEAQAQAEEKKRKEEDERQAEEERAQREREEQKQREEAEARQREEAESRQREEAERLRQEREKHFQKEEAERSERKKRLEEIMKRTRRSDPAEKKATPHRNGDGAASTPISPGPTVSVSGPEHSDRNGHGASNPNRTPDTSEAPLTSGDERENGSFEEVIELPPDSRLSPHDEGEENEEEEEKHIPVIAFRENGILKPLSGVDDVPAQQRADVI